MKFQLFLFDLYCWSHLRVLVLVFVPLFKTGLTNPLLLSLRTCVEELVWRIGEDKRLTILWRFCVRKTWHFIFDKLFSS